VPARRVGATAVCVKDFENLPGVSAMSLYVPPFRVRLDEWCGWTGNNWDKVKAVVGQSFRVCGRDENVYTMAANAALRLIVDNRVDPSSIGFFGLGTESSTDNAAGAVIVRGMLDRALESLGLPRLSRNLEVPEFKHACLGGIYGLKNALRYVAFDGRGRQAIVVSADVAEYERGSSGEQTQGAGAVAMLVENTPKLFAVDLFRAGSASDYRGPDFRKPFARHFTEGYAQRTTRPNDFPIFSGEYSTFSYIDETVHAVENMLSRLDVTAGSYYRSVRSLFFHRPYHLMPVRAMSFLYVRGLARGKSHHDELGELCAEAKVSFDDVMKETSSSPDLYEHVLRGTSGNDPYVATNAVAGVLRKRASFRDLLAEKMSLGSDTVRALGNLYSAALPAWIGAGLEEGSARELPLEGANMVAVGYGSGDAAEAIPFCPVPGWQAAARTFHSARALEGAIDLTQAQYESLHDHREISGIDYTPRDRFVISRVGTAYDPTFQDLGVEYYEYVPAS
jgi:hydroxymethylglutaryl-CoA synthase